MTYDKYNWLYFQLFVGDFGSSLVKQKIFIQTCSNLCYYVIANNNYIPKNPNQSDFSMFPYQIHPLTHPYQYSVPYSNIYWLNGNVFQFNSNQLPNFTTTQQQFPITIQNHNPNNPLFKSDGFQRSKTLSLGKQNHNVQNLESENIPTQSSFLSKKQYFDQHSNNSAYSKLKEKQNDSFQENQMFQKGQKINNNPTENINSQAQIVRKLNDKKQKDSKNESKKISKNKKKNMTKDLKQKKQVGHWKRTILSNMYRDVFTYLIKRQKSQKVVIYLLNNVKKPKKLSEQILKNMEYTLKRYFNYQQNLKQLEHYSPKNKKFQLLRKSLNSSADIYSIQEQNYYNKISRITAKLFIQKQLLISVLNKQKFQKLTPEQSQQFYLKHVEAYREIKNSMQKAFNS